MGSRVDVVKRLQMPFFHLCCKTWPRWLSFRVTLEWLLLGGCYTFVTHGLDGYRDSESGGDADGQASSVSVHVVGHMYSLWEGRWSRGGVSAWFPVYSPHMHVSASTSTCTDCLWIYSRCRPVCQLIGCHLHRRCGRFFLSCSCRALVDVVFLTVFTIKLSFGERNSY